MGAHELALAIAHIASGINEHLSTANLTIKLDTGKGFIWVSSMVLDVCVDGEPKVKAKVMTSTGKKTTIWVGEDFTAVSAHRVLKGLLDA